MKAIVFIGCFLFSVFFTSTESNSAAATKEVNQIIFNVTYERILINGQWWIFVYEDGKLINQYPE
ncbi:MAG: hypothetical protein SGI89_13030 [bacterium]|nr:hypothetical protein [bacterium]